MQEINKKTMTDNIIDGQRIGRYIILRDVNGQTHAVSINAVTALANLDDGTLILLPGGRLLHVPIAMSDILVWLNP